MTAKSSMKILLDIKPAKHPRSDLLLHIINKLNEFLEAQDIADFAITLIGESFVIVEFTEEEKPNL